MVATYLLSAVAVLSLSMKCVRSQVAAPSGLEFQPRIVTPSTSTITVDSPSTVYNVASQPSITPSTVYLDSVTTPNLPQSLSTVYVAIPLPQTSTAKPSPTVKCKTGYRIAYDSFKIWGSNWAPERLNAEGPPGMGLKRQISACGKVTAWKFKENKDGWDFYAYGHTLIGTKHCIERAMLAAGSGFGRCHGTT